MSAAICALKRRTALLYSRLFDGRLFLIFISIERTKEKGEKKMLT
jgi:hypothetical protein